MPSPSYNDLDDAFRHTKFVPKESFKEDLRARLQQRNRRREDPAFSSNGWRRPLSIQPDYPIEDKTMSNSRLIPIFAASFVMVLVVVLAGAILIPRTPIADVVATPETGEFRADDLSDIEGVWSFLGITTTSNENYAHLYMQFNADGTGLRDFGVEQHGDAWLVIQNVDLERSGSGKFLAWFEDGNLHLKEIAWRGESVSAYEPAGIYEAYVIKEAGKPVALKLVVVEDANTIRKNHLTALPGDWIGPALPPSEDN